MLEYRALGGLSVVDGGAELGLGGSRQRRLAAALLIERNRVVSVDRLGDVVFAGEPTPGAATTLRSYVARLRRVVERAGTGSRVVTRPPGYVLEVGDEAFDVARFEGAVAVGRACLARGDAAEASRVLGEGLGLWRGGAYAEFADEEWARPEAQRLGELHLVAYELLADAELACGRAAEVVSELEVLAAEHPLREAFQAKLMLALYRSGRQVEALRVYQAYREVLAEELGLDPPPELAELEGRILVHDEALRELEPSEFRLRGYRLGERLGTGREGTVYAARLPGVDRDIVVRVVPEALANDPGFVRSFDADAQRVAALRHPAVVPLYDWWREPGAAYVVMRRLRGGTLRDRVQRARLAGGDVAALVARVGAALAAVAEAGIARGRVVAESILFDEAGDAYLADLRLGTGGARVPGDDVRDLAGVVAEALTGSRPIGPAIEDVPATVAEVLTAALSEAEPPQLDSFVPAVMAALSGQVGGPAYERPNPYKGLRAFDEPDAEDFFGRDALVDAVLARLAGVGPQGRLVLVVGGSGSGKSSLVRAGLLPQVRRGAATGSESWFVAAMVPGGSPFKELAESLRRVAVVEADGLAGEMAASVQGIDRVVSRIVPEGGELLLVVDQLEELFTLARHDEQRAFLDGLTHAVGVAGSRLRVVATLRADFYDRPLRFERFGTAVGDATVPIAAMSAAELEAAIVGPAERVGARVEPALAAELVGAVLHEPAALPSLQFTLYELAERSPDGNLTLAAYRELGGVDAAIAARAEDLYRSLDDPARDGVRRLFERLVVVSAEGEPTRRRALRTELAAAAGPPAGEVVDIIEVWAQARLLTLDRHPESRAPTVEVAHEALLREWPRLRSWLEDDREDLVALGQLREAATSWEHLARDPGALYRGARLDTALQLADRGTRTLAPREREFLDASRTERDRARQDEADQHERTARANRRLRTQLVALAVALVVALVVGTVAVGQRDRAERAGDAATARELAAAANANVDVDSDRSILLALAAVEQARSAEGSVMREAEEALHRAVAASRIELHVPGVGGRLDWSPDGKAFVTEGPEENGAVDVRDAATGTSLQSFPAHDIDINDVAFHPDGTLVATAGADGAARVWDLTNGEEVHAIESTGGGAWGVGFSPDGSRFAAAWFGDGVKVMDLASGRIIQEITAVPVPGGVSFDPSGARIAIRSESEPVVAVVDVESGAVMFTLDGQVANATDVAWSPDGTSIATAGLDGRARIFDARTGALRFTTLGRKGQTFDLDWSPDATRLVTANSDGVATVWQMTAAGPQEQLRLSAHEIRSGVSGVAFSPDGTRVMAGNFGTTAAATAVVVWDVTLHGDAEVANLLAVPTPFGGAVAFTADGRHLVASGAGGSATVWEASTFTPIRSLGIPAGTPPATASGPAEASGADVFALAVSPDGELVAAARLDGTVRVWSVATGRDAFVVDPGPTLPGTGYINLAWSPNGEMLAVAANDGSTGRLTIVDRTGRQVTAPRQEPTGIAIGCVRFSPDSEQLITTRLPTDTFDLEGYQVEIRDWRARKPERTIETTALCAVPSPAGNLIATAAREQGAFGGGKVDLWDWDSGQHIASLPNSTGTVALAFSADGSRLATAGHDGTIRIWDPSSGEQLLALDGHDAQVSSVAFSPDGSHLASIGAEGTVRVWTLELDDLVEIAEREVTRPMSAAECRQYLHRPGCP